MPFICEPCGREFDSEAGFTQHNRDKHGTGKESIAEKKELEHHLRKEKKELEIEKSLKSKQLRRSAKYGVAVLVIIGLLYFVIISLGSSPTARLKEGMGAAGSQHVHADFKVYLAGVPIDFSQQKYQLRAQHVHVEGGDGDVVHVHATGVKIGYFFSTLGMKFNQTCFALEGRQYCNDSNKTLKFFVNSAPANEWESYIIQSRDSILISYGSEANLTAQFNSITKKAEPLDTGKVPLPMR